MAAIEKIWANRDQYYELVSWLELNNPECLNFVASEFISPDRSVALFPEYVDMWLLDNCPLNWLTEQIKTQYGLI